MKTSWSAKENPDSWEGPMLCDRHYQFWNCIEIEAPRTSWTNGVLPNRTEPKPIPWTLSYGSSWQSSGLPRWWRTSRRRSWMGTWRRPSRCGRGRWRSQRWVCCPQAGLSHWPGLDDGIAKYLKPPTSSFRICLSGWGYRDVGRVVCMCVRNLRSCFNCSEWMAHSSPS